MKGTLAWHKGAITHYKFFLETAIEVLEDEKEKKQLFDVNSLLFMTGCG